MTSWWRRWQRRRILQRRPIADGLWSLTLARYPFLARRSGADAGLLREMATLFLAEKEFSGAGGLRVSDAMAVAIAAQACLPVLRLGFEWLDAFVGVVVHADAVVARREVEDDTGVVHSYDEELSGEAMHGGPVMLSWRDVDDAGESAESGYNVVVHEFAHVVDMRAGLTSRAGALGSDTPGGAWLDALTREFERFSRAVARRRRVFLDPYAAEALQEFFAVGAEAFFVVPLELTGEMPQLYALLRTCFRQDPAATQD